MFFDQSRLLPSLSGFGDHGTLNVLDTRLKAIQEEARTHAREWAYEAITQAFVSMPADETGKMGAEFAEEMAKLDCAAAYTRRPMHNRL